jgi:hypothetical protein
MKKMVLRVTLSLAALAFLMSPALAAASPLPAATVVSVADQAFLASLAVAPAGTPVPELAAKRPGIRPKATCTAICGNGSTVSCSGTTCTATNANCPTDPGHVVCDGATTACASSTCTTCSPTFCDDADAACSTQCDPCPYTLTCSETTCTSHCRCNFRNCLQ